MTVAYSSFDARAPVQGSDVTVTARYPYSIKLFGVVSEIRTVYQRDNGACGMTIDYRIRNIVIAAALAAAAVLLTVVYVTSARNDTATGKENVTVYVPSKDYAVGNRREARSPATSTSRRSRARTLRPRP